MKKGFYEGDCFQLLKDVPSESVNLVLTDPPYGICFISNYADRFETIQNDDKPCVEWLPEAFRATKNGGGLICFCRWDVQETFRKAIEEAGFTVKNQLVWVKDNWSMGDLNGNFASQHEVAWFATKGDFKLPNGRPTTVLEFKRVHSTFMIHPTEKPVAMMRHLIEKTTVEGDTVLDPFAGSGSVPLAAKQSGRLFYAFEIEPIYCNIVRDRLAQSTANDWFLNNEVKA